MRYAFKKYIKENYLYFLYITNILIEKLNTLQKNKIISNKIPAL